jgi:TonB-linked SusC/RagA family outer membrane protein
MYNEDGTYNLRIPENANTNPRATAAHDDQSEKQIRGMSVGNVEWKPLRGLTLATNNSAEFAIGEGRRYWSPEADYAETATLQVSNTKYIQLTTSNTVSYDTYLMDVHSIRVMAGQEATNHMFNSYYIYSPNVDPAIPYPNTASSDEDEGSYNDLKWTMLSFFGNLEYNYDSKYYLKASIRTDGSSKFGANNRWGNFYSVGASWNMHEENFLRSISAINTLKIRASFGVNGNDNFGSYDQQGIYAHWGVYSSTQYNGIVGMAPSQPENPDLTWEVNTAYNGGIDFAFFDRLSGSFEYYYRVTTDMLLNTNISRTSGFSTLRRNVGSLSNTGWEGLINYDVFRGGEVEWSLGANIAHNKSKILDLGDEEEFINTDNNRILHRVGESLYQYYLYDYAGVNPVNGDALWYTEGEDGERGALTNIYADARRYLAGSPEPKFLGGINSDVKWNGISLSLALEYKLGGKVLIEENRYLVSDGYNWGTNQANTGLDYWKEPGDIVRNPKPIADNTTNSNGFRSTRWMFDGDYLRIKNITLSYSLPKNIVSKINLEDLRIYGSAVNAFTFHDVDFWDPERGVDGSGFGIYPQTKSFVIGLDIKF